ncbi:TetR/AcrR family transcriptional regulator [Eubacterium sp.]|uniref:TetR/AcrR family transcriptional regulator n=1 Tax=Eubacterium sp. TaxID=142586 RepID=UPI003F044FF2
MDKRIVRTRRAILLSILQQTKDKDIKEVRVVRVCKDAGINKSTFYLHYKGIEDCVNSILENLILSVAEFASTVNLAQVHNNPSALVNEIFNEAIANQDFVEHYKSSRLAVSLTDKLQETAINTICTNNNIQYGSAEWARVSLIVYAVTGIIFSADVTANRDVLFSALTNIIRNN